MPVDGPGGKKPLPFFPPPVPNRGKATTTTNTVTVERNEVPGPHQDALVSAAKDYSSVNPASSGPKPPLRWPPGVEGCLRRTEFGLKVWTLLNERPRNLEVVFADGGGSEFDPIGPRVKLDQTLPPIAIAGNAVHEATHFLRYLAGRCPNIWALPLGDFLRHCLKEEVLATRYALMFRAELKIPPEGHVEHNFKQRRAEARAQALKDGLPEEEVARRERAAGDQSIWEALKTGALRPSTASNMNYLSLYAKIWRERRGL